MTPQVTGWIETLIRQELSPQQVVDYLRRHNKVSLHLETVYQFIYDDKTDGGELYRHLLQKRRYSYPRIKRRRQVIMKARKKRISERPSSIAKRTQFGHWEGDLILFRHTKTNVLTLRERKSRLILVIKNDSRKAKTTARTLIKYMKKQVMNTM